MKDGCRPVLKLRSWLALMAVLLAAVGSSQGRTRPAAGTEVFVTASFEGPNGLFLENLTRDEVRVLEDGRPRKVEFLAGEEIATVYGLLMDRAVVPEGLEDQRGTMRRLAAATTLQNIAYELIDKGLGRQTVWVGSYGRDLSVLLDFSSDGFRAKDAIQRIRGRRQPEDSFLYGSLLAAVKRMSARNERRRVLFAFLGLIDSDTLSKVKTLKNFLSSSNVELFIVSSASQISSRTPVLPPMSRAALTELGEATAGETLVLPAGADHPEDAVRRIHNRIRTFYTIGFETTGSLDKPAKLQITCTRPGSRAKHHPVTPLLN